MTSSLAFAPDGVGTYSTDRPRDLLDLEVRPVDVVLGRRAWRTPVLGVERDRSLDVGASYRQVGHQEQRGEGEDHRGSAVAEVDAGEIEGSLIQSENDAPSGRVTI